MTQSSTADSRLSDTPRTNYIFIDCENVHEPDISRVEGREAVVHLILGAHQVAPPAQVHTQIQQLGDKAGVIRTPIAAKNALDFVLACQVGMQAARDPQGYFHIISKDKGFDVVVKHLKEQGILAARRNALKDVPALMKTEERLDLLICELSNPGKPRPVRRKTLESVISAAFDKLLTSETIDKTIRLLIHEGILAVSETGAVTYPPTLAL